MVKITNTIINEFVKSGSGDSFNNAYAIVHDFLSKTMDDIMLKNSLISSYNIYVANEVFTGTEFRASSIDIFLELRAIQVELNFENNTQYVLKSNIRTFLNKFAKNFKLFNRKKINQKKKEKSLKREEEKLDKQENYDVLSLYKDIQIQLAKKAYKTTKIALKGNCISLLGKDEFGLDINIYPVFASGDTVLNLYNLFNKKATVIDFRHRWKNLETINQKTKKLFKLQVRIFNNLYWNVFKSAPNQIFIESLLYSVPEEFFTYDIYETTLGIVNYLKNSTMQNLVSICDNDINLLNEPLNTVSIETAHKFIKNIQFI